MQGWQLGVWYHCDKRLLSQCVRWKRWNSLIMIFILTCIHLGKVNWWDGKVKCLPQGFMRKARALFIHLASLFFVFFFFFYLLLCLVQICIIYSHNTWLTLYPDSQLGHDFNCSNTLTYTHKGVHTHLCACWWPPPWWKGSSPLGHFLFGCHGYSLSSVHQGTAPKPVRQTCLQQQYWVSQTL